MEYKLNRPISYWSFATLVAEATPQETYDLERAPQYFYIDVHGPEIAQLRERIEKLEKKLEENVTKQLIPIQFLDSDKLELKQPIFVSMNYCSEGEVWIVDCPELNLYGEGQGEIQAIDDFKNALEEFYFGLKKDKEKLGSELRKKLDILQRIIEEK